MLSILFRFWCAYEGVMKHAPKALASRRFWWQACQKMFIFRASEMPFPMLYKGRFHRSEEEKTLTSHFFF